MSQIGSIQTGGGGGTPITQLDGDTGTATGATINVVTGFITGPYANGTSSFIGDNASTLTWTVSDGQNNVGLGNGALFGASASGANQNAALGNGAGANVAGSDNVFVGINAGNNMTGSENVCLGAFSSGTCSGNWNILIGSNSGSALAGTETSNIYVNNNGVAAESNTLRIGKATGSGSNQDLAAAFICGINAVNVGSVASVVSISGDQLGSTTITAGAGITITPGANTITISSIDGGLPWVNVTGTTQAIAVNTGYIANNAGLVTLTLPATAAQGSIIRVAGQGAGGWTIAQNTGQLINFGSSPTTITTGSLSSTNQFDVVELLCTIANTTFNVLSAQGNLTIL